MNAITKRHTYVALDALEVLWVFVLAASILGTIAALAGMFRVEVLLPTALLVAVSYAHWSHGHTVGSSERSGDINWYHVLLILAVALVFRLPAFQYVFGGQDQGVYVNMASSIVETGSVQARDRVIEKFPGEHYDTYMADNYGQTTYLPGVYRTVEETGRAGVDFQFYHLFPIWMAMAEGTLGPSASPYALTFFALLSLVLIYCLVELLTGQSRYGFLAALLVAVNPLHSFFSKWPVTEVPTLAFAMGGFVWLAAYYYRTSEHSSPGSWKYLVLSALSFGCLFFTRISGFLYLPVILALYFAALYSGPGHKFGRNVGWWFWGVVALYVLSVLYGLGFSTIYSAHIYEYSFSRVFGDAWAIGTFCLLGIYLVVAAFVGLCRSKSFMHRLARLVVNKGEVALNIAFVIVSAVSVYRVYTFAFTGRYINDAWIQGRWQLANKGLESVAASSLLVTGVGVTPFIAIAFLCLMVIRLRSGIAIILKWAILVIFTYIGIFQFFIPFQPYYDRYLTSELIPYILIFVIVGFAWQKGKIFQRAKNPLLALGFLSAVALSLLHVGKVELAGTYESLKEVASEVRADDVLLMDIHRLQAAVKTPLVYKLGRNVVSVSDESLANDEYLHHIASAFADVWLLSTKTVDSDDWVFQRDYRVVYDKFNWTHWPAHKVSTGHLGVKLYRMSRNLYSPGISRYGSALGEFVGPLARVVEEGVRSGEGRGFVVFGPYKSLPAGEYELTVWGVRDGSQGSWTDVVSRGKVFFKDTLPSAVGEAGGVLVSRARVVLPTPSDDVEVRVFAESGDTVTIHGYKLVKTGEVTSEN